MAGLRVQESVVAPPCNAYIPFTVPRACGSFLLTESAGARLCTFSAGWKVQDCQSQVYVAVLAPVWGFTLQQSPHLNGPFASRLMGLGWAKQGA